MRILETQEPVHNVKWSKDESGNLSKTDIKVGYGLFLEANGHFLGAFDLAMQESSLKFIKKKVVDKIEERFWKSRSGNKRKKIPRSGAMTKKSKMLAVTQSNSAASRHQSWGIRT